MKVNCQNSKNGALLSVYASPGAKKNEICGLYGSCVKIKIKAMPSDGKANKELIKFLSSYLSVPASLIEIVKGLSLRKKKVLFKDMQCAEIMDKLSLSNL